MWFVFALLSAVFAALTSILAKVGIEGVNSNLATAIRTMVVLAMAWGMVFVTNTQGGLTDISRKSWLFLILSGLATGASWLCYYRALQIGEASKVVPIFRSGNMSLGIALLRALAKKAAGVLGDAFDVEIVEAHHNRKLDAPSGTALMLLDAVKSAYPDEREAVFGRHGRDCKRQHQEIGMHSLRGGTVTGEHEVCFFGTGERIRISHSAENRGVFAAGALRAAAFLMNQQPGMYSMDDVVGQL
ncbi:MAG: 4-hydroxy-tetrahydrodipicolinate reductase [Clostridiales bacterium]|nr:4-hydroxy-tetrahydrodipicolinate reductase [Clostridiales bacterium]